MAFSSKKIGLYLLDKPEKNHRKFEVIKDEWYRDPNGERWNLPAGTEVNGLSLPQWRKNQSLWKNILFTVGRMPIFLFNWTPWTSNARTASLFHDHECDIRERPADAVHKMFYDAMIEKKTPKWQAQLFYNSVKLFEKW